MRCLKNKLTAKFEELDREGAPIEEYEKLGAGKLRAAVVEGDMEWGSVMAGQISALIDDIRPTADIIRNIFGEAEKILNELPGKVYR